MFSDDQEYISESSRLLFSSQPALGRCTRAKPCFALDHTQLQLLRLVEVLLGLLMDPFLPFLVTLGLLDVLHKTHFPHAPL